MFIALADVVVVTGRAGRNEGRKQARCRIFIHCGPIRPNGYHDAEAQSLYNGPA